ncbi:AzlC family ABC transporter permease [Treponema sp. Marseille-Q3903]|uniref:AzlC family ABC transporter permease n=1 Tax=Treponema sp. Marseille-Q3903 TaxID=2766703 RepID=UPI001651C5E9|nr:AzlC family ABC transporter permease [Treponema sp. Marseille-Q3903]
MKEFKFALKHTFPIFVAYIFLGIAFGILMINSGYGTTISLLSSIFVYAGSMQFVMIPLMVSHTSIITLAVMAFFVNARHLFYGQSSLFDFTPQSVLLGFRLLSRKHHICLSY